MLSPPQYTRRSTHRTPSEIAERGSRALRSPAERRTTEQGRVRRRRWGGATMQGSRCLPGAAPNAAEGEEARSPAEGMEGGGRGGGGGLENGTDRRRCERAKVKTKVENDRGPVCAFLLALAHKRRRQAEHITPHLIVPCDGKGSAPWRANVEQRAGGGQRGGARLAGGGGRIGRPAPRHVSPSPVHEKEYTSHTFRNCRAWIARAARPRRTPNKGARARACAGGGGGGATMQGSRCLPWGAAAVAEEEAAEGNEEGERGAG
jgi:hypothetical protein